MKSSFFFNRFVLDLVDEFSYKRPVLETYWRGYFCVVRSKYLMCERTFVIELGFWLLRRSCKCFSCTELVKKWGRNWRVLIYSIHTHRKCHLVYKNSYHFHIETFIFAWMNWLDKAQLLLPGPMLFLLFNKKRIYITVQCFFFLQYCVLCESFI